MDNKTRPLPAFTIRHIVRSSIHFSPTGFISKVCFHPQNPNSMFHIVLKVIPLGAKLFRLRSFLETFGSFIQNQGGRIWHPIGEHKNGPGNFGQACIYYVRDKCIKLARNCKFANVILYNMQYISYNSAILAKEKVFLTKKKPFFCPKSPKKGVNRNKYY